MISKLDELRITEEGDLEGDEVQITLREAVSKIPGPDGWWKSGSREDYEKMVLELVALGVPPQTAVDLLSGAYWAAADCFGG